MVSKAHGSLHGKTIHMKWYLKPGKGIDFSLHCESTLSPENSWQTREVVINLYTCKIVIRLPHQRRGFASRIVGDNRISSVQLLSRICFFATPWTAARQASLSITNSQSLLKLMSIESVMASNHLIFCHLLLLPPSIFPSIRIFSNESALCIRWPKYWSFSFSISPSSGYSGLISFKRDWLDLLAVQGTLKSLLQHHSSKASILQCSAFFMYLLVFF